MKTPTEYTLKHVSSEQLMEAIAKFVLDGPDGSNTAKLAEKILCTTVEYLGDSVWRVGATDTDEELECSDNELAETIRITSLMEDSLIEFIQQQTDFVITNKFGQWYTDMPMKITEDSNVGEILDGSDGEYFQWLKPFKDHETGEQRYIHLDDKGEGMSFSKLQWGSVDAAKASVESEDWGYSVEDVKDCVVVQVTKRFAKHPFNA